MSCSTSEHHFNPAMEKPFVSQPPHVVVVTTHAAQQPGTYCCCCNAKVALIFNLVLDLIVPVCILLPAIIYALKPLIIFCAVVFFVDLATATCTIIGLFTRNSGLLWPYAIYKIIRFVQWILTLLPGFVCTLITLGGGQVILSILPNEGIFHAIRGSAALVALCFTVIPCLGIAFSWIAFSSSREHMREFESSVQKQYVSVQQSA